MNSPSTRQYPSTFVAVLRVIESPQWSLRWAWLLAAAVSLPSLGAGLLMDDWGHQAALERAGVVPGVFEQPSELFTFATGDAARIDAARRSGFYPWWADDGVRLAFWRPFTVWTHRLDQQLWPRCAPAMHAQSIAWGLLSVWLAALVLRRVHGDSGNGFRVAGVAVLVFAADESRALPVMWVANRNAVVGLACMLAALWAHLLWRQTRRRRWLALALPVALLALLANEGSVALWGFLFAHALWLDRGPLLRRLACLTPYGLLLIGWRWVYRDLGYGVAWSPSYVDPLQDPMRFLEALFERLPVLVLGLFGNVPVMPYEFLSSPWKSVYWWTSCIVAACVGVVVLRAARRSASVRFWGTALALALVPATATLPSGRLLGGAALATAALLAHAAVGLLASSSRRRLAALIAVHLICALVVHAGVGLAVGLASRSQSRAFDSIAIGPGDAGRTAILLDSPTYFASAYATVYRRLHDLPTPRTWFNLAPNQVRPTPYEITRIDDRTLRYTAPTGFPFLLLRNRPLESGSQVDLDGLVVEVVEVLDSGEARIVDYRFAQPLEAPAYVWLRAEGFFGQRVVPAPREGETLFPGRNRGLFSAGAEETGGAPAEH